MTQPARAVRQCDTPRLHCFVCVGGTDDRHVGDRAQSCHLFNGLMRWPVFTHADAIVRKDIDDGQFHDRRQANGRAHVIRECEERRAERDHAAVQRHAVERRAHRVFTHTPVKVAPAIAPLAADSALPVARLIGWRLQVACAFECCVGRRVQVRRAADDLVRAGRSR
jgi:hypothetical protein